MLSLKSCKPLIYHRRIQYNVIVYLYGCSCSRYNMQIFTRDLLTLRLSNPLENRHCKPLDTHRSYWHSSICFEALTTSTIHPISYPLKRPGTTVPWRIWKNLRKFTRLLVVSYWWCRRNGLRQNDHVEYVHFSSDVLATDLIKKKCHIVCVPLNTYYERLVTPPHETNATTTR